MSWRVEWKCALRDNGGQCVISTGIIEMRELPANNSNSPQIVRYLSYFINMCCVASK